MRKKVVSVFVWPGVEICCFGSESVYMTLITV